MRYVANGLGSLQRALKDLALQDLMFAGRNLSLTYTHNGKPNFRREKSPQLSSNNTKCILL